MNWGEVIAYSVYVLTTTIFMIVIVNLALKNKKQAATIAQISVDRAEVLAKLGDLSMKLQEGNIEKTDGFIKFMAESRDWAFSYIEDVQAAIQEYQDAVDGMPVLLDVTVEKATQINDAYEKLVSFLPNEQ